MTEKGKGEGVMFKLGEGKYLVDIPYLLSTLLRFLAQFMLAEFRANLHSTLYMGTSTDYYEARMKLFKNLL